MVRSPLALWAGEILLGAGVAGLLLPALLPALGFVPDLLFLVLVIAGLSLAAPFLGTGFRSVLTGGAAEVQGIDALFLSVQCVSIALGIGVARGGLDPLVSSSAIAIGIGLLGLHVMLGRRVQ